MSKKVKPQVLSTPELSLSLSTGYVLDVDSKRLDQELFEKDWEHREPEVCKLCNGTKHNPEHPEDKHCMACEGTGIHYILCYGVKNKQTFGYIEEFGVNGVKEFCKAMREVHAELQAAGKVGNASMIMPYALPKTIEMELNIRGYNPLHAGGAEVREIANIVAKEWPEFLCVNYKSF